MPPHRSNLTGFDEVTSAASGPVAVDGLFRFTPKHRFSLKNNPLSGVTAWQFALILSKHAREVDWAGPALLRVAFLVVMACLNTGLALVEHVLFGRQIAQQKLHKAPVFVLGHPRTGTTLLHNYLARDTARFGTCSTFAAGFPSSFLWFAPFKGLLAGILDETRPMDRMPLSFDLPQEDELATTLLSAGASYYMVLYFMRTERKLRHLLAFDPTDADGDTTIGEVDAAREAWRVAFLHMCKKLTVEAARQGHGFGFHDEPNQPPRLVLKSPVHTARIPLLRALFPDCQFIYVHRNPYEVFASACNMADTTYWFTYLCPPPSDRQIQEFVLWQYEAMWEHYEHARAALPGGALVEVAYTDLVESPVSTLARVYDELGWAGFPQAMFAQEARGLASYRPNTLRPLDASVRRVVAARWGPSFARLGYEV